MTKRIEERFRAARYRHLFLRHSIEEFDRQNHKFRFQMLRQQHPEQFERVKVQAINGQIRFLRMDRI